MWKAMSRGLTPATEGHAASCSIESAGSEQGVRMSGSSEPAALTYLFSTTPTPPGPFSTTPTPPGPAHSQSSKPVPESRPETTAHGQRLRQAAQVHVLARVGPRL